MKKHYKITAEQKAQLEALRLQFLDLGDEKSAGMLGGVLTLPEVPRTVKELLDEMADERDNWTPRTNPDGTLHQSTLKVAGERFRCSCGCNVFHQPNDKDLSRYACNACGAEWFRAQVLAAAPTPSKGEA